MMHNLCACSPACGLAVRAASQNTDLMLDPLALNYVNKDFVDTASEYA